MGRFKFNRLYLNILHLQNVVVKIPRDGSLMISPQEKHSCHASQRESILKKNPSVGFTKPAGGFTLITIFDKFPCFALIPFHTLKYV